MPFLATKATVVAVMSPLGCMDRSPISPLESIQILETVTGRVPGLLKIGVRCYLGIAHNVGQGQNCVVCGGPGAQICQLANRRVSLAKLRKALGHGLGERIRRVLVEEAGGDPSPQSIFRQDYLRLAPVLQTGNHGHLDSLSLQLLRKGHGLGRQ